MDPPINTEPAEVLEEQAERVQALYKVFVPVSVKGIGKGNAVHRDTNRPLTHACKREKNTSSETKALSPRLHVALLRSDGQ